METTGELLREESASLEETKPGGPKSAAERVTKAMAGEFITLYHFLPKNFLLPLHAGANRLAGTRADLLL